MRAPELTPGGGPRFQKEGRGIVDAVAGGYYIARRADDELFKHLVDGDYCHVLAPRQIGKSSLRVRTQERLRARGIRCASVDLTGIGSHASPDEWYFSLASAIGEALELPDPADLWQKERRLSTVRRFRQFLHDAVLVDEGSPVVVFIDEIDVTLALRATTSSASSARCNRRARTTRGGAGSPSSSSAWPRRSSSSPTPSARPSPARSPSTSRTSPTTRPSPSSPASRARAATQGRCSTPSSTGPTATPP